MYLKMIVWMKVGLCPGEYFATRVIPLLIVELWPFRDYEWYRNIRHDAYIYYSNVLKSYRFKIT